jgi:stage II sporulation protein D
MPTNIVTIFAQTGRVPLHTTAILVLCFALVLVTACATATHEAATANALTANAPPFIVLSEVGIDSRLQRAASAAMENRDGAIIVMEPQSGRIRALVNEQAAFGEALSPGSTAKPLAMLAALEAGILDSQSRLVCREHYRRADTDLRCSHTPLRPAFSPANALAHSCNYFHATFGERMQASALAATFTAFGFDRRTDAGNRREAVGAIPHDVQPASLAIGEAHGLRTTPVALISAYAALANGGVLLTPQRAGANVVFHTRERSRIQLAEAHRRILLEGMRSAVTYGTAAPAELNALPFYIFGKTGTASSPHVTQTHGWFVGFATDAEFARDLAPARLRLAILVLLRQAHGSDAAHISRSIFEEFARAQSEQAATKNSATTNDGSILHGDATSSVASSAASSPARSFVRLRLVRQARTIKLPLDDYLFGVLAAEASTENEREALKAQAIVSRTYALRNLNRHARESYDFCDLTHCQRFLPVADRTARDGFYEQVRQAISETREAILTDERGHTAEAYFSASCGGRTANIADLWGIRTAPRYLQGVTDPYCALSEEWTDVFSAEQLHRALQTDPRSDTGARLTDIRIVRRDASGRVARISLIGERTHTISGWTFKTILGRALGWNKLKSTRFSLRRAGDGFLFQGRGFGHGLGLCQAGAHEMARRGANHQAILNYYFPGRHTAKAEGVRQKAESVVAMQPISFVPTSSLRSPPSAFASDVRRRTLSSSSFRVSYPARTAQREIESVITTLEQTRADLSQRIAAASISSGALTLIDVFIHSTTADFSAATGQPSWVAAAAGNRRIQLQPLDGLRRRGVLTTTLRHEYTHALIEEIGRGRTPRWLTEGLAAHVAGEGRLLTAVTKPLPISLDELERRIAAPRSAAEMRSLYAEAYRRTSQLIREEGERRVWQRVASSLA